MPWLVIQLGSREHYAIPSALTAAGALDVLVTDAWVPTFLESIVRMFSPSLAGRRANAIPDFLVHSRTMGRLLNDSRIKLGGMTGWKAILQRNNWFQDFAVKEVCDSYSSILFSYSYTARLPFMAAKQKELLCILGQIDPGPREFDIVDERTASYRHLAPSGLNPPAEYWRQWREEISLSDWIVVNSSWAAQLLLDAGVPSSKLIEIPLVYGPPCGPSSTPPKAHKHPDRLQALFLGSVILRKGAGHLFDAMQILQDQPVDFTFAGPIGLAVPEEISSMPNVRFLGSVDRQAAVALYGLADVFLFPTLSDGFGLTQLEALGHGLPVIASTNCASVVQDRVNGLVLKEVTPETIAEAIMELVDDPYLLARLQANASVPDRFHPRHLAPALLALASK